MTKPVLLHDPHTRPALLTADAALFLDFDGTLVAIAPQPDAVVVDAALRPVLQRLYPLLGGALGLVSGRRIAELDAFVAPLVLPAAGVHGAERRDAQGRLQHAAVAVPEPLRRRAQRLAALDAGLLLEDKQAAIALHWRRAPRFGELCLRALRSAVRAHPQWRVLHGKSVAEVKPAHVSKGHAVQAFCAEPPFAGRVPVFIGDDTTDEDGFAAVQAAGGIGIKVGEGPSIARRRLPDTQAVLRWMLDSMEALERAAASASETTALGPAFDSAERAVPASGSLAS